MPVLTKDQIKNAPPGETPSSILFKKNTREIKTAKRTPLVGVQGKKRDAQGIVDEVLNNFKSSGLPTTLKKEQQFKESINWRPQPKTARLLQKNPVGNVDIYDINHQVSVLKDVYKRYNLGSVIHPGIAAGVTFAPIVAEAIPRLFDSPRVQEVVRRVSERFQPEYLLKTAQILKDPGAFIGGTVGQKLIDIPVVKDTLKGAQQAVLQWSKVPAQLFKEQIETSSNLKIAGWTTPIKLPFGKSEQQKQAESFWRSKADNYIAAVNKTVVREEFRPDNEIAAAVGGAAFSMAAAVITTIATKSPVAAGAMFGVVAKGAGYERAREAGVEPSKASIFSTIQGVAEGALEAAGLHLLLKPTTGLVGVAKKMLTEATQESSQEVAGAAIAKAGGYEDRTLDTIAKDVVLSGAIGAVMGGAVGVGVDLATERKTIADISKTYGVAKNDAKTIVTEVLPKFQKILADQGGFVDFSKAKTTKQQIAQSTGLAKSQDITAPESSLLKGQIKQQVKGAKVGARAGRLEIYEKLKNQEADISETRADVEQYVVDKLPKELRGNFLKTVRTIKPTQQAKLAKTFVRVDTLVKKHEKQQTIGEIKKLNDRIQKADTVDSDFKDFSRLITDELTFSKPSKSRRMSLKKKVDFLEREIAKGTKPYHLHREVLKAAKLLSQKPIQDLSQGELNAIKLKLEVTANTGKSQRATSKTQYQQKVRTFIQTLQNGNIVPVKQGKLLGRLNIRGRNLGESRFSLMPMDNFLDLADDIHSNFDGANYTVFQGTASTSHDAFLTSSQKRKAAIAEKIEPLKLTDEQRENITLYAAIHQPGGLEHVGSTKEEAKNIKLSNEEKVFYDYSQQVFKQYFPLIQEVYKALNNKKLPQIENYSPFFIDYDKMSTAEVRDIFAKPTFHDPKQYRASQTKYRSEKSTIPIKMDAVENLSRWVENAEYYINMSEDIQALHDVAHSKEYAELIKNDVYVKEVQKWVGLLAKKGDYKVADWMDILRHNAVTAIIPFKAATSFVQLTAMVDGASVVGLRRMAIANEALLNSDTRSFIENNFPQVKSRTFRESDYELLLSKKGKGAEYGTKLLRMFDHWAYQTTAYSSYIKYLEENNLKLDISKPNKAAIAYAQGVARRTQASTEFMYQPSALTRGTLTGNRSLDRSLLMLNNFLLTRFGRITRQLGISLKTKTPKETGEMISLLMYIAFATIAETGIRESINSLRRKATGEVKADEDWYTKTIREAGRNIPLVGNVMATVSYDSDVIGAFRGLSRTLKGGAGVYSRKEPTSKLRAGIEFVEGLGTIVGIPGTTEAATWARSIVNSRDEKRQQREKNKIDEAASGGRLNLEGLD